MDYVEPPPGSGWPIPGIDDVQGCTPGDTISQVGSEAPRKTELVEGKIKTSPLIEKP